jgi:hypothetical protein
VGFAITLHALGDMASLVFLFKFLKLLRTSGVYIALPSERQRKSRRISVARAFRRAFFRDCKLPT